MLRLADAAALAHRGADPAPTAPPPPAAAAAAAAPDRAGRWSRWSARWRSPPAPPCWPRNGSCTATACSENRTRNVGGGVLIGAGAALTVTGAYVTIVRAAAAIR